jgi:hypothetical protein
MKASLGMSISVLDTWKLLCILQCVGISIMAIYMSTIRQETGNLWVLDHNPQYPRAKPGSFFLDVLLLLGTWRFYLENITRIRK